ncbi:Hypothetical protein DPCES_4902 [Desulfitobacterium hafniense]|uniref:SHOCT domain-containing protein n=1 Tax=Desulfitobacterium hafniense TaxID=49338 RepID=A0A098B7C8_DESHA|nr:SHOCT domain-containing protein [Desulfitobacterium hafniense]CDX04788.1 Hypothetical protein DPCES_4902 [Desulfitobacterium hafniense]
MMIISWIFLILLMLYWVSDPGQPVPNAAPIKDASDVLRERYARGEIEFYEFEERLRVLKK